MKHLFSFYLIILLSAVGILPTAAQQHFNKRYTDSCSANYFSNVVQKNNKYYVIVNAIDSVNYVGGGLFLNKAGLKFLVLDSLGNKLYSKLYQREDKIYTCYSNSNNLRKSDDGTFLFSFGVVDTSIDIHNPSFRSTHAALAKFDSLGNVLLYKEYERPYCSIFDATNYILMDFKPDAFGNWLMLSSVICNGPVQFCLRKLDSNFNELWVKRFSTSVMNHIPAHLLIEPDGYVMTGGIDNGNMKLHTDYYASVLIKCDTSGNPLWTWQNTFDTTQLQYTINDILRSKDGGYVYCGSGQGEPTYFSGKWDWSGILTKGWVEKLDASRKSVWKRALSPFKTSVNYTQQTVLKELTNGDIMVAGSSPQLIDTNIKSEGWIRGTLTRLSGMDGHIIWQRYYRNPDNDTMRLNFYDMRQTADGGYILAGESFNLIDRGAGPTQRGWLIKVDSNGCLGVGDPQCWPTSIKNSIAAEQNIKVFPNPSTGQFTIESNTIGTKKEPSLATVYDILGRIVLQNEILFSNNQAHLSIESTNGIYILELKDKEGNSFRTPIQVQQ